MPPLDELYAAEEAAPAPLRRPPRPGRHAGGHDLAVPDKPWFTAEDPSVARPGRRAARGPEALLSTEPLPILMDADHAAEQVRTTTEKRNGTTGKNGHDEDTLGRWGPQ